nr:hypothetical protein [uncultured Anaeromusa sp.]
MGTYGAWISKNEAYEKAQVTPLEAKRYLNSFLKLAPEATLEKGRLVSESVPEILRKFKFMESSGLKMEEIEQALEKNLAPQGESLAERQKRKEPQQMIRAVIEILMEQAEVQRNMFEVFTKEITKLQDRIAFLEKKGQQAP